MEENYVNYYNAQRLAYNLKKIHEHLLNQENTLGILCILESNNLGLEYNKKLFAYGEKSVGIVSYKGIIEPKEKQLERENNFFMP